MRIGVCSPPEKAAALKVAGADYIELAVSRDLAPEEDERAWSQRRAALEALPLPAETFHLFVPGEIKIVGPDSDPYRLGRYAFSALERAAQVGGKIVVLGSGGARGVPAGYPFEAAYRELTRFLHQCADAAERFGVRVVIEPLGVECPFIASVAEGAALARRVGRPGVANLADTWHMENIGEPLEVISREADTIAHVHTAAAGRRAPGAAPDRCDALAAELARSGYAARPDARLSLECNWTDFDAEIGPALARLRQVFSG